MCWLPPRVTWQPTLPRCALRDRPTISPVASLGVRSSTKNERHLFPKPRYIACYSQQGVFDTFLPPLEDLRRLWETDLLSTRPTLPSAPPTGRTRLFARARATPTLAGIARFHGRASPRRRRGSPVRTP